MKPKKIVLIGGPATGKTTLIEAFKVRGYQCMEEISRQITIDAQKNGVKQLFLEDPIWFSQQLLDKRKKQFFESEALDEDVVFFDRGLPDVVAYLDYIKTDFGKPFIAACENHKYDEVFILPPWKKIHKTDNERYESFEQLMIIHEYLEKWYDRFGYNLIKVAPGAVEDRIEFILNSL